MLELSGDKLIVGLGVFPNLGLPAFFLSAAGGGGGGATLSSVFVGLLFVAAGLAGFSVLGGFVVMVGKSILGTLSK